MMACPLILIKEKNKALLLLYGCHLPLSRGRRGNEKKQ